MNRNSWISRMIIPCKGIDRCEYYKPEEKNHPQEHMISKVIYENECNLSTLNSDKKYLQAGKFLDNLAPVPYNSKLDPPSLSACFNCWYLNHTTRECFSKKRFNYCSNCGRRNVEVEDCPRCCKAYCEYIEEKEHILAKIELYGDKSTSPGISFNFYKTKEEDDLKPVKNKKNPQIANFGKEGEFKSDSIFEKDSETSLTTNEQFYTACANNKDFSYDSTYKNNYTEAETPIGLLNDIKTMSLSTIKEHEIISGDKKVVHLVSTNTKESENEDRFSTDYSKLTNLEESEVIYPTRKDYKIEPQICPSSCHIDASKNRKSFGESLGSDMIGEVDECKSFDNPVQKKVTFNTSNVSSRFVDEQEEDEDYEDIIIDEDEKSVVANETGDTVLRFMDLLNTIKHLPIEAQNIAVNCFVNAQKKHSQV